MQMTLNIDDDVLKAAEQIAQKQGRRLDEVISELARKSLPTLQWEIRNGVPLIPKRLGSKPVTNDMVNALKDDDY